MEYIKRCYRKSSSLISKEIEDEVIFAVIKDNIGNLETVYTLDGVGAYIWKFIDGKTDLGTIKKILIKKFNVKPEKIEGDLISLFKELENAGCIEMCK